MTSVFVDAQTTAVRTALTKLHMALQPLMLLPWMNAVLEPYFQQRAVQRFQSEGDDVSGKWAPLKPATINIRTTGQIDYGAGPINVRTGALERYVTESQGFYTTLSGEAVMVYPGNAPKGSNVTGNLADKLRAAQQGLPASGNQGPTPPRPVIGVNERDLGSVLTFLELYLVRSMI